MIAIPILSLQFLCRMKQPRTENLKIGRFPLDEKFRLKSDVFGKSNALSGKARRQYQRENL
jgi:hypothetical protein